MNPFRTSIAPFAKMSLEVEICLITIFSPLPEKITLCSPVESPALIAETLIFFYFLLFQGTFY